MAYKKPLLECFMQIRIDTRRKELYQKIARACGLSMSAWVIATCNEKVKQYLKQKKGGSNVS